MEAPVNRQGTHGTRTIGLDGLAMPPAGLQVTESCPLWNLVVLCVSVCAGTAVRHVCMWARVAFPKKRWRQLAVCKEGWTWWGRRISYV